MRVLWLVDTVTGERLKFAAGSTISDDWAMRVNNSQLSWWLHKRDREGVRGGPTTLAFEAGELK